MLKRKFAAVQAPPAAPHALASIYDADPTKRQRKRLFCPRLNKQLQWTPAKERDMTELLEFILQHEEAFNKY